MTGAAHGRRGSIRRRSGGGSGRRGSKPLLDAARPWLDAGDATLRDGRLAIPAERFLLSDAVIAALFWEC